MRPRDLSTETLVRYVQGEMTRSESDATMRLVADSRREQERVAELRAMFDELRRPPDWVPTVDLVEDVHARLARESAAPATGPVRSRWRGAWWPLVAVGAAAAILAVVALVGRDGPGDVSLVAAVDRGATADRGPRAGRDGSGNPGRVDRGVTADGDPFGGGAIRPKGTAPSDPDRWVGIRVAEVRQGNTPVAVNPGSRVGRGGLQVAYTNLGPQPYSHLMVFAVDAAGQVRWFYPAYERAGTDPAAIAIEGGAADLLLPDLVEHEFARGRLALCGLFLRAPLTVGQVEAALSGRPLSPGARLPFPGSGQRCLDLEVE